MANNNSFGCADVPPQTSTECTKDGANNFHYSAQIRTRSSDHTALACSKCYCGTSVMSKKTDLSYHHRPSIMRIHRTGELFYVPPGVVSHGRGNTDIQPTCLKDCQCGFSIRLNITPGGGSDAGPDCQYVCIGPRGVKSTPLIRCRGPIAPPVTPVALILRSGNLFLWCRAGGTNQ